MDSLEQPRTNGTYKGSNLKKAGILNVIYNDLPKNYSLECRKNIIIYANEVYHLGTKNKLEYARILCAKTAIPLIEKLFVQDDNGKINLDESIFMDIEDNYISIVHNHTNGSFFSDYDISAIVRRKSIKDIFLASNGRLLRLAKSNKLSYNVGKSDLTRDIIDLATEADNYYYLLANCGNNEYLDIKKNYENYGLIIERW